MKRRNLLIAIAAVLVMFAFVACSESVAPEDRLGTITFDNNTSRAVGTVVTYSNEVEDMYWYYSAAKQDDGYTTGDTKGKLLAVSSDSSKGLSGKTLNNNFSYGLWNIELMGFKATTDVTSTGAINESGGGVQYKATITNFLVDKGANYAKAEIKLGDNPETKIVFDTVNGISFKSDNIKANSDFTLTVEDTKGTVTVGTGADDVVKTDCSVTFKNLTYELKDNAVITGEHEMKFVLTQKLSGTGNTSITAARYTLKFTVQPGTKTTISGTLLKTDETGTIEITSVQDVPELTLSKVMPVEDIDTTNNIAKVKEETKINYGDLEVVYPEGAVISTEKGSIEGTSSDAKIGFEYKTNSEQTGITIDATEAKMTFELSLSASTSDESGKKNEKLITIKKFIGKGLTISNIYHVTDALGEEDSETVPTDGKEGYFYNSETGYLTLYVLHASEFNIITKGAVAAVGDKKYYSLSEAITDVSEGGTVTLLTNVAVDSAITIDKNITLDLMNKVVDVKEGGSITLSADKVVTIENSTASQTSLINEVEVKSFSGTERSYYTSLDSALAAVKEGGTVTLLKDNVPLSNDVAVSVTFTLDLNSKTVTASGKYVIVEDGTLTVKNKATDQSEFICGIAGENGTYTVGAARIGGTCYASLKGALEAAVEKATVILLRDTTMTETATVSNSITLDLNDKIVTVSGDANVVVGAGTLTVTNKVTNQTEFVFGIKGEGDTYTAIVAKAGDTYYASLESAIEATGENSTVKLLRETTLTETVTVSKSITLDLNNKVVTVSDNVYVIVDAGTLTVANKVSSQTEFVFGVKGEDDTYTAVIVSIGSNYYSTFDDALKAASSGDTITLQNDITVNKQQLTYGESLTVDLNKKTLTLNAELNFGKTTNSKVVAVTASIKNGTVIAGKGDSGYLRFENGSVVTFDDVNFKASGGSFNRVMTTYAQNGESRNIYTFNRCEFDDTKVEFSAGSYDVNYNEFDITFNSCKFTADALKNRKYCISTNFYVIGKLTLNNTTFDIENKESGTISNCAAGIYIEASLDSTKGKKVEIVLNGVTMNTKGNAYPYKYNCPYYNGSFEFNATVTAQGTNTFTHDGVNGKIVEDTTSPWFKWVDDTTE